MPEEMKSLSVKCKVCGGDIVRDYMAGTCVCAHCGNKWPMEEMVPDYRNHKRAIELMTKANEILIGKPDVASAGQVKLLYKRAIVDCTEHPSAISAELIKLCNDGLAKTRHFEIYARGKNFFDKQNFRQAMSEFKKIPDYRDVQEMIPVCEKEILVSRRKHIPLAILVGMVLPAIIAIVLSEKVGLPIAVCIPVFIVLSAATAYAVYLEKTLSVVIIVLSFICAVPLILFMILAYGFHMETRTAAIVAVVSPIAIILCVEGVKYGNN